MLGGRCCNMVLFIVLGPGALFLLYLMMLTMSPGVMCAVSGSSLFSVFKFMVGVGVSRC